MTVMMLPTAGEYANHKGERFETDGVVYNVGGTECYLLKGYGLFAIDMLEVVDELKYRKKPVIIEAYQTDVELDIPTLEGTMHASVGDYIITGVRGERYPCKPDIFEETYEPAQGDKGVTKELHTVSMPPIALHYEGDVLKSIGCGGLLYVRKASATRRQYESPVAAHWDGDVLVLTTTREPSSIHVQQGEGQTRKVYTGESELISSVPETCEMEYINDWMGWHCKSCDNLRMGLSHQKPKYCPNCGRKVVDE